MKKTSFLFVTLLFIFLPSIAVGQGTDSPMASFMDLKWGTNLNSFVTDFKYAEQLKKDDDFYYLLDFQLGDLLIPKIKFKFETKDGQQLKLNKRQNYDFLFLTEIYMFTKPEQFDTLFTIFKAKYGEPKKYDEFEVRDSKGQPFTQSMARWEDEKIKRMILMERLASKLVDGMVTLIPIKEKVKE